MGFRHGVGRVDLGVLARSRRLDERGEIGLGRRVDPRAPRPGDREGGRLGPERGLDRPQGGSERRAVVEAIGGALGQQLEDQVPRRRRQRLGVDGLVDVLAGDLAGRAPLEGKSMGEEAVCEDADRVQVGARVDPFASDQLGSKVLRLAGDGREHLP